MNEGEPSSRRIANLVGRIVLAAPLLLAGAIKLADPLAFRRSLDAYGFFPPTIAVALAVALPPFEVFCGGLLITKFQRRAAALATACLMLGFSLVTGITLWRGGPEQRGQALHIDIADESGRQKMSGKRVMTHSFGRLQNVNISCRRLYHCW